ncbi:MAG TPA: hypothetical protein PKK69_06880, partial [Ferruginibacter sp.]|nr:hypothetical protein [Ferruginibacter sp.]
SLSAKPAKPRQGHFFWMSLSGLPEQPNQKTMTSVRDHFYNPSLRQTSQAPSGAFFWDEFVGLV